MWRCKIPKAAPKACRHFGCKALAVAGAYCDSHKPKASSRFHGSAGLRKTGRKGVKDRDRIRARDCGLCQQCLANGKVVKGSQVDHIIALCDGGQDSDDNKQLLCDDCHTAKSRDEARRRGRGGSKV